MATEIERWLEGLGLARYTRAFADNDIDMSVVGELSELEPRQLGVSLGHGKKLLRAIAAPAPPRCATASSPAPWPGAKP